MCHSPNLRSDPTTRGPREKSEGKSLIPELTILDPDLSEHACARDSKGSIVIGARRAEIFERDPGPTKWGVVRGCAVSP